jgi:hypothetical protein
LKAFFNGIALLIAVTCLVWVAVLWSWQSSARDISISDIVLYLGLLPLVMILLIVMSRWAWAGVSAKRAAQASAAAAAQSSADAGGAATPRASDSGDAALRHVAHAVWLAAAHTAAGATATDLLNAAKDNDPRPQLDAELVGFDGFPVMSSRLAELDLAELEEELPPLIEAAHTQLGPDAQDLSIDDAVHRALAALSPLLQEALAALAPWRGTLQALREQPTAALHVLLGCPPWWNALEQRVAQNWVQHHLAQTWGDEPPLPKVSITLHTGGGEALWLGADQTLQMLDQQERQALVLALATHSDLSDKALTLLEDSGQLFHPNTRPKGHMPGEAAAAVMLASLAWPEAPPDADANDPDSQAVAWVHRPALARRDKSIDAAGKVQSQTLQSTIDQAQVASQLPADAVGALIGDADQHTPRGTELFGITLEVLPHLDPTEDMRLIGTVCAGAGAATPLSVVATACAQAKLLDKPVLATCLGAPFMRMSLLVRPSSPPGPA